MVERRFGRRLGGCFGLFKRFGDHVSNPCAHSCFGLFVAIFAAAAILIGLAGLFLRLNSIAFGEPRGPTAEAKASFVPMFAHLALVCVAGVYMPPHLVAWFQNVAKLLG